MHSIVADHCSYIKVHLKLLIIQQSSLSRTSSEIQLSSSALNKFKARPRMKFFIVFSALLVLAAAFPSSYVMKQEKEFLEDILQQLENAQANIGINSRSIITSVQHALCMVTPYAHGWQKRYGWCGICHTTSVLTMRRQTNINLCNTCIYSYII